jgi:microcystin-dependent protein
MTLTLRGTKGSALTYEELDENFEHLLDANIKLVPAGGVMFFAMNSAPTGWLVANGANVSRTTYSALFAAIGTTFGVGNGSTTFTLPDLRGEFIRGWDSGRGIDTGRVFGSLQTDEFRTHTHTGTTNTTGAHTHAFREGTTEPGDSANVVDSAPTAGQGNFTVITSSAGDHFHTFTTAATGGVETRPRNVALLACIKF